MRSGLRTLASQILPSMPWEYTMNGMIPRPMQSAAERIMLEVQRRMNEADEEERMDLLNDFLERYPLMPLSHLSFDGSGFDKATSQQAGDLSKSLCRNESRYPPTNKITETNKIAVPPSQAYSHVQPPSEPRQPLAERSFNARVVPTKPAAGIKTFNDSRHPQDAENDNAAHSCAVPIPHQLHFSGSDSRGRPCYPVSRMPAAQSYACSSSSSNKPVPPQVSAYQSFNEPRPGLTASDQTFRPFPQTRHPYDSALRNSPWPHTPPKSRIRPYAFASTSPKKSVQFEDDVGVRYFDKEISVDRLSMVREQRTEIKTDRSAVIWD